MTAGADGVLHLGCSSLNHLRFPPLEMNQSQLWEVQVLGLSPEQAPRKLSFVWVGRYSKWISFLSLRLRKLMAIKTNLVKVLQLCNNFRLREIKCKNNRILTICHPISLLFLCVPLSWCVCQNQENNIKHSKSFEVISIHLEASVVQ